MWHWGNTAYAFAWDGREVVVTRLGERPGAPLRARRTTARFLGTRGYHHGERLHVVRDERAGSATWCARRSSTPARRTTRRPRSPAATRPHHPPLRDGAGQLAWETVDMLKSGTRRAGVAVRGK